MIYRFFILSAFVLTLFGCGQKQEVSSWMQKNGKIKVLATTGMIADIAQKIGGHEVDVLTLIPAALDPHSYELVKGDDEKFAQAELILCNGLGLEHGMSLRRNLQNHDKVLCVTSALQEKKPESILRVDGVYDPHVWMDISLWMETVDPILQRLCALCPQKASIFENNAQQVKKEMEQADAMAYERLQSVASSDRYLVTSHDAFHYFTRRYLRDPEESTWQIRCRAPEGLAPDAELSVSDLRRVLKYIVLYKTHVLFTESNVNKQSILKLIDAARKKGHLVRLAQKELYADSMGEACSYIEMVLHNVDVIAEELAKK